MSKIINANCKNCNSQLIIDVKREDAYCPYCGKKVIQHHNPIGLKTHFVKNVFTSPDKKYQYSGAVVPNEKDSDNAVHLCYSCTCRSMLDNSKKDAYCSNCGAVLKKDGRLITSVPDSVPGNQSPQWLSFVKKHKWYFLLAAIPLFLLILFGVTNAEPGSDPQQKNHSVVETVNSKMEKPTQKPTVKATEKPTAAPTEPPTEKPTDAPTEKPTEAPTEKKEIVKDNESDSDKQHSENHSSKNNNYADNGDSYNADNNEQSNSYSFILNKNTKKYHYPTCSEVKKIKEENKETSNESPEYLKNNGYSPCKKCNPK